MKNFILLLVFFLLSKFIMAQSYVPFQFGNTRWMYNDINMFRTKSYCYFSMDTTGYYHNGNKFWKIEYVQAPTYSPSNSGYYLFDDTVQRKVFIIDTSTNQEYLLYDFSANVGDTINSIYNAGSLDTVVVDSIDYISINTILRKHIYVHPKGIVNLPSTWIEGIGATYELFLPSRHLPTSFYVLMCHEHNSFINYGTNLGCSNFLTSIKHDTIIDNHITISFNPENNSIHIENPNALSYTFYLYGLSGKVIEQYVSDRTTDTFLIGHITDLIVLYNIIVKGKINQKGKIVKR